MANVAFTWHWRTICEIESFVAQNTYYYDHPADADLSAVAELAGQLKKLGYINVRYQLITNLPTP